MIGVSATMKYVEMKELISVKGQILLVMSRQISMGNTYAKDQIPMVR